MRNTCEKYSKIKVPWKHRETFINLSNNQNIVIMKHDNGGRVVIMNINKYFDTYLALLSSEHFVKSNQDPIATTKTKAQRILQKIKQNMPKEVYQKRYPTASSPKKFYGTTKIHKV